MAKRTPLKAANKAPMISLTLHSFNRAVDECYECIWMRVQSDLWKKKVAKMRQNNGIHQMNAFYSNDNPNSQFKMNVDKKERNEQMNSNYRIIKWNGAQTQKNPKWHHLSRWRKKNTFTLFSDWFEYISCQNLNNYTEKRTLNHECGKRYREFFGTHIHNLS